jgi:hypothetical protein
MKFALSKSALTLIIAAVLALTFIQAPASCSINLTNQEKAEAFLENVVEIDVTKYEMKLVSQMDFPADENGVAMSTLLYNLKSQESKLEVIYNFRNNALVSCNINPLEGSPLFARPTTDTLNSAKNFLDKYQSDSKATYVQPLRAMLNDVTELKPLTAASNDVKLTITTKDYVYIEWMKTPNGIHNMYNRVILAFQNGAFKMFTDSWNRYSIGTADVSVSKEQAISIAKDRARSFSYKVGNTTISNMTVLDKSEFMRAELTMQPRENALYPHWELLLPLDQLYPGMTTSIRVTLWADTGEISSIKATGTLGVPQGESPNTAEAPPSGSSFDNSNQIERNTNPFTNADIVAGVAVTAIAAAAVAIAIKKRKQ